jgi:hypothetical protein
MIPSGLACQTKIFSCIESLMTYIRFYKAVYLVAITINLGILMREGAPFGDFQYFINIIAILINSITFAWINKAIFIYIEKILSIVRMTVILLISFLYPLVFFIYIIPTAHVLWLPLLEINKMLFGLGNTLWWVVYLISCTILFVLEILFFHTLSLIQKTFANKNASSKNWGAH